MEAFKQRRLCCVEILGGAQVLPSPFTGESKTGGELIWKLPKEEDEVAKRCDTFVCSRVASIKLAARE
jgi:hypothetical protein